ncbi:MAG: UTP--glucose-1-phosphate uridylyltransferase GalU [Dehalococcoidia bacterium]|nr:UTP--glucose-1-phosphate uridylyltransferase GalU [Dehalococcoidia bacterium]
MPVRKAVILAAGYGTRFLPATKAIPKEMLPIVDRPVIQYIVEEAVAAGLDQIIMVTSAAKRSIEDHFDRQFELEHALEAAGKRDYLDAVRGPAAVQMAFVRQKERLGNGHAVLITRPFVGDEPFAIFFPDDVIFHHVPAIRQLIAVHERYGSTVLAVQQVPPERISLYGVIDPRPVGPRLYEVQRVIEKPPAAEAPSNLATVGRFVATPEIFDVLEQTPPGRAGEVWLMDAFDRLRQRQTVHAYEYEGERFDCGQPLGLLEASLHVALQRDDMRADLKAYIRSLDV